MSGSVDKRTVKLTLACRDAYVKMKAKEKGIDIKENRRGGEKFEKNQFQDRKFNAFREMSKIKNGETPDLATIPTGTAVVGKPPIVNRNQPARDHKRSRDDDGDDRGNAKWAKTEVSNWPRSQRRGGC